VKKKRTPLTQSPKTTRNSDTLLSKESFIERHFWQLGGLIVLLIVLINLFNFTLIPPSYKGLYITRPFYGLHSWAHASGAWAARSHAKYGLGYTKGFSTLVLGDPPPENPTRYVSHPSTGGLLSALGILIFGVHDWSIRLFHLLLAIPLSFLILMFLRKIYGSTVSLMALFFLAIFPLCGYFGFSFPLTTLGLWAFYRYLHLTGRLSEPVEFRRRHFIELALAVFLTIQFGWTGTFIVFTIGLHYVVCCLFRRQKFNLTLFMSLLVPGLLSLGLNLTVMASGYDWNIDKIFQLYKWRSTTGERQSHNWHDWVATVYNFAKTNFTGPILILLLGYVLYLIIGNIIILISGDEQHSKKTKNQQSSLPYQFRYLWFFLLPGIFLLSTLKALVWEHQYWQRPFALFVALATSFSLLLIYDLFKRISLLWGRIVIISLLIFAFIICNQGLADYRRVRWQSPRTIELFQTLNQKIPPGQALLTSKNFMIKQSAAKPAFYRPEYAWYLDREMVVARTMAEVLEKAQTGRFPYYFIPDTPQPIGGMRVPAEYQAQLRKMSVKELENFAKRNKMLAQWEWQERLRLQMIEQMKKRYPYEYFDNPAQPGEENYCNRGNTPCYIFDLKHPKKQIQGAKMNNP